MLKIFLDFWGEEKPRKTTIKKSVSTKKPEGKLILVPTPSFKKELPFKSIQPVNTFSMLTLSFTVPGDVAPGVSTRSSGFVKSNHGMYAFKRIGTIPRQPEACVFNCQSDGNWVVIFARSSGKMDPIFTEYSLEQTERGAVKEKCKSRERFERDFAG